MPVLRDIPINLTPEEVIPTQGQRKPRPGMLEHAEEAIALGQTLWEPVAVYDRFAVRCLEAERVHLTSPTRPESQAELHIGRKADLLQEADEALVSVGTIGPALEEKVRQLQNEGENLKAYLLDSAGVVALGAVGESLRCLAEETAAEREWGVSAALSPGSLVGWPLRGQKDLCSLLSLEEIGVQLNKHNVLQPHKSFSTVVGLGPGYQKTKVGSACKYCALQNTCWRRREDPS